MCRKSTNCFAKPDRNPDPEEIAKVDHLDARFRIRKDLNVRAREYLAKEFSCRSDKASLEGSTVTEPQAERAVRSNGLDAKGDCDARLFGEELGDS